VRTVYQSFTHLAGKAFSRLEEYSETLGAKLFRPRVQAFKGPLIVEVQNTVAVRLCPWINFQVLFI
jgi:hypothetical protein